MRKPLTDTLLRALKKPEKGRLELADASCRGLEFRITAAGNRSWSYRYRAVGSGKLQRATIGPYPGISLAQARAQADAMRAGVALGENPSEAKRRERREAPGRTFEVLANRYLTEYARRKKKSAMAGPMLFTSISGSSGAASLHGLMAMRTPFLPGLSSAE